MRNSEIKNWIDKGSCFELPALDDKGNKIHISFHRNKINELSTGYIVRTQNEFKNYNQETFFYQGENFDDAIRIWRKLTYTLEEDIEIDKLINGYTTLVNKELSLYKSRDGNIYVKHKEHDSDSNFYRGNNIEDALKVLHITNIL